MQRSHVNVLASAQTSVATRRGAFLTRTTRRACYVQPAARAVASPGLRGIGSLTGERRDHLGGGRSVAHRRIGWILACTLIVACLPAGAARAQHGASPADPRAFLDASASAGAAPVPASPAVRTAATRLREKLGPETVVDVDPKTGTPREILSLDAFLSGPHRGDP